MRSRRSLLSAWLVIIFFASTALSADTPSRWTDAEAKLTLGEYLQLYFQVYYGNTTSDGAKIVSVEFVPSESPKSAILVITRSLRGPDVPKVLLNEWRKALSDEERGLVENFGLQVKMLAHANRWSVNDPAAHLIIRDISANNAWKTIAVTIDGKTCFDESSFHKAESIVESLDGTWPHSS